MYDISLYVGDTFGEANPKGTIEAAFISTNCEKYCDICHPVKTKCLELDTSVADGKPVNGYKMSNDNTYKLDIASLNSVATWIKAGIDIITMNMKVVKD